MASKREGLFDVRPGHTEIETRGILSETQSHAHDSTQVTPRGAPVVPDSINKPGIEKMTAALMGEGDGHVSAEDMLARPLDEGM